MNKHFAALALIVAASSATNALAAPEAYVIEGKHTFPRFSYSHLGLSTQVLRFNKTSGKIVVDKETKTGSIDVVIDAKSVDTGLPTFDEHIQNEDFFYTEKFPVATFKSDKIVFSGDQPQKIEGLLTIKGITKPMVLTVTSFKQMPHPMLKKDTIGADAFGFVKRSDFNMGKGASVGDEIRIDIAVEAIHE